VYNLGGLAVQNLLLAVDKMNVTVVFRKPVLGQYMKDGSSEAGNLAAGMSDIGIGSFPLVAAVVSSTFQPTIPYEYTAAKWFVPCPQPVERMEKVMHTYQIPVWLTMTTVLILTGTLWWGLANWRHSSLKDSQTFQTLSYCLYSAWAVAMGVSATNKPNTWKFRLLFLVYVWYCFAMSTVFQAFFTSYLVEPGYGNKFETFDDLLNSSVAYGYNDAFEFGMASMSYKEHERFPYSGRQDCDDMKECMKRIANNDQLCTISVPRISQYLASEMGIRDSSQYLCSLEENLVTTGFVSVLRNGNPLLYRLNALTRRSVEGGLLDRYWTQLLWIMNLRSKVRFLDAKNGLYFVFSLSHLSPAFSVLAVGWLLSSVVFLAEVFVKWIPKLHKI
jgi:hypothetical protein